MLVIFLRAVILYIALLVVMRLMGKRQIGEMQPFEFIITLLIAELACVPMTDVSIPLSYGLVSVLAVFILHQLMSLIEKCGPTVKFFISGKPSIVITPEGVNISELKKNNMNVEDLAEAMLAQGYFSFDDLSFAIFESNGKLSALPRQKDKDEGLSGVSVIMISNGKLNKCNLNARGLSGQKLLDDLRLNGVKVKKIEVLSIDNYNRVYLKIKNEKYRILHL